MSDDTPSRSSAINITGNSSVSAQDLVAGDKNIYIVLVGQFLDQLKIQELFPKLAPTEIAQRVQEQLQEGTLSLSATDADHMAFAGRVLEKVIKPFAPPEKFSAFLFRGLLDQIPQVIGSTLEELSFWQISYQNGYLKGGSAGNFLLQVVWLYQTQELLRKAGHAPRLIGIARIPTVQTGYSFVKLIPGRKFYDTDLLEEITSADITSPEFRIIMVGLIIDLIRIHSDNASDQVFWNHFVDFLASSKT